MTPELRHPHFEGDPRPGRRLLEYQRDALPLERCGAVAIGAELLGTIQEVRQLPARKLFTGQEMASHSGIVFRAVTWNLFHGRDFPPSDALFTWRSRILRVTEADATHVQVNRPLLGEFGQVLDSLDWHVALLQEVPPRWLEPLAQRCRAVGVHVLTARNELGRLRGILADLNPDLIASNEGGSNVVLARRPARIEGVQRVRLATSPERRSLLLVRVAGPGGRSVSVACMHLSVGSTGQGPDELVEAARRAVQFAGADPLLLGGDLNLSPARAPEPFADLTRRFGLAAPTEPDRIDHLLGRGLTEIEAPRSLPPAGRELPAEDGRLLRLSDHCPVVACFEVR